MNILVTGGTGCIGSLTCLQLMAAGHHPAILDHLMCEDTWRWQSMHLDGCPAE